MADRQGQTARLLPLSPATPMCQETWWLKTGKNAAFLTWKFSFQPPYVITFSSLNLVSAILLPGEAALLWQHDNIAQPSKTWFMFGYFTDQTFSFYRNSHVCYCLWGGDLSNLCYLCGQIIFFKVCFTSRNIFTDWLVKTASKKQPEEDSFGDFNEKPTSD